MLFVWLHCGSVWGCDTAGCWQTHSTAQGNREEQERLMERWKALSQFVLPNLRTTNKTLNLAEL